jgi:hypothetical protein
MRLPGTHNTKKERRNAPCNLIEFHPQRLYDLVAFAPYSEPAWGRFTCRNQNHDIHQALPRQEFQEIIETISRLLLRHFDGYEKANGWIASRCPCGHISDHAGSHFNFHPQRGIAYCFGKHGRIALTDLWDLIHSGPSLILHLWSGHLEKVE